jgi:hypothetical protein
MKLEIQSVADKGNFSKERLILRAKAVADIGDYVLIQAGYSDGGVNTSIHNTYWFPYKDIGIGDLVVLYTKSGKENEKELKGGRKAHFFYWGLDREIWSFNNKAPVLMHAPEWTSKAPEEL